MLDYLLLPYGSHHSLKVEGADGKPESRVPPGMSEYGWKRVGSDAPPSAEELEATKTGLVRFLGCGVVPEMEVAVHLVVASADTRHSVATTAEAETRKVSGVVDWNDPGLVSKLYGLFLGTLVIKVGRQCHS